MIQQWLRWAGLAVALAAAAVVVWQVALLVRSGPAGAGEVWWRSTDG